MNNPGIRTRLLFLFVLPVLGMFFLAFVSITTANSLSSSFVEITEVDLSIVTSVEELKFNSARLISSANELILDGILGEEGEEEEDEEGEESGEAEQIAEIITEYNMALSIYSGLVDANTPDDILVLDRLETIETVGQEILDATGTIIEMNESGASIGAIIEQREELEESEVVFLAAIDEILLEERVKLESNAEAVQARALNFDRFTIIFVIVIVIVVAVIAIYIFQSIFRPLGELSVTASSLLAGDLAARSTISSRDELGQFAATFNSMVDSLEERQEELEKARDEALEAQKLASENARLKSEFLSTMSHELRTPLNAIEGFTSIMLSGMGVDLNERAEGMIQRVSSNSKRLLHLINDFLDLSRIEADRLELVQDPLSPATLVREWEDEISILASERGLEFRTTIDPDLPATIYSDEDALTKITINLLSNACKFTHEGRISLVLEQAEDKLRIIVADTGIGIPSHARQYIFDEFRQVDGSSKRLYGGTGLGLALVQKLSRAMGGSVTVQSEVGVGSTFTVTLPLITELEEELQGATA